MLLRNLLKLSIIFSLLTITNFNVMATSPTLLEENKPILEKFNVDNWHENGYMGKGVNVLVLDLNGKLINDMESYATLVDPENIVVDEAKHNTYVSQIVHSFAKDSHIYVAPWTHSSDEIIEWVRQNPDLIDIVNVSLNALRTDKFEIFRELDIPVVASAGNRGSENSLSYPASLDWTISVGAYNWMDRGIESNSVTNYSNGGELLDVVSPTNVYVKSESGNVFYYTGTSTSSPALVGMLACYIQFRKENGLGKLGIQEAKEFVHNNAIDIREEGFGYKSGHGLFVLPEVPIVTKTNSISTEIPIPSASLQIKLKKD